MKGINSVFLLGRAGAAPEYRQIATGKAVVKVSLATNYSVKRGEDWVEETEWHKVEAWGRQAEFLAKYCNKGDAVAIQGRIKTDSWTDKEGLKRYTTKVVASRVELLGRRGAPMGEGVLPSSTRQPLRDLPPKAPDLDQIPF